MGIFCESWQSVGRTLVIGVVGYGVMLVLLRISGPRTLSKMNAFDFIVTIALGSTLASLIVSESVSLASGAVAFGVLIGLQFCVTWASVRAPWLERVIKGEPRLVLSGGEFRRGQMRRARVTE
ncbi:MAG: DUF421 domain-containing protein [Phycisphaerales bacterium]